MALDGALLISGIWFDGVNEYTGGVLCADVAVYERCFTGVRFIFDMLACFSRKLFMFYRGLEYLVYFDEEKSWNIKLVKNGIYDIPPVAAVNGMYFLDMH